MSFIFLYGPPGSGKSTLAASMTNLGLKVRFIDVDDKVRLMDNLQTELKKGNILITQIASKLTETTMREAILTPKVGLTKQPKGYLEICDSITEYEKMFAEGKSPTEQVIVIDSLTSQIEHMKRLISHIQGKTHYTYEEWAIVLNNLEEFFYTMKGLLKTETKPGFEHVIIIAHETTERDETTGAIQTLPSLEGQMRHKVGKYFEEVYYCRVEIPKGGTTPIYKILTVSTDRYTARTSRELPIYANSDFAVIFGKVKAKPLDAIQLKIEAAKKAKEEGK